METAILEGEERGEERGEKRGVKIGEERGIKIGEARGKAEERLAIARNMLELELPLETIIKATGLSSDEIKKLAH
jgi:predicted transposase YdaD